MNDLQRPGLERIGGLADVAPRYRAIFCDVWGVVHDGERKSLSAEAALMAARKTGAVVVLVTNSPRPADGVAAQLDRLGVSRSAYDHIATSGDVTRKLIVDSGSRVFHLGPARDLDLFEGLPIARVGEAEAEAIVCTGLFEDEVETPDDYADLLARLHARRLPMICANPDVVVHRGERLIFCAGALARDYAAFGGRVAMAGKPHRPIYEFASLSAGGATPVLAIGDGLNTDIRGANDFGIDALLIVAGIHGGELGGTDATPDSLEMALGERGLEARYFMNRLG